MSSPTRLTLLRHVRLLGNVAQELKCDATTVAGTVLRQWCKQEFPAIPHPQLPFSEQLAESSQLQAFVVVLQTMEFLEGTYWLSSAYAILSDAAYRKRLAMYFTPVSLTKGLLDDLASQGADFGQHTFFDPACGGAAFLSPIALRMQLALKQRDRSPKQILRHIERHLTGTDKDSALCSMTRQFLYMALYSDIKHSGYVPKLQIKTADSLLSSTPKLNQIDVVVCNPPYRKVNSEELGLLRAVYSDVIEAQPNLYGLFINLCIRLIRPGGLVALVTPTSFLSGQYFRQLRSFLICNVDIKHIGMVSTRAGVFIDVEQETALTILQRRHRPDKRAQTTAAVSVVSAKGQYTTVGRCILPNSGLVWPIPRIVNDVELLSCAARAHFSLSDYGYKIRIGSYVWNRDSRPKYETALEVKKANAKTAVPLIWSRDISSEGVSFDPDGSNGNHRFVDLGNKCHSSVITKSCVVMQRVTSNEQPRRLVAAIVPNHIYKTYGGFVGENHIVILEPVISSPVLSPKMLASLLNTKLVDRIFRCISGATNVSAFELSQLTLPDPVKLKSHLIRGEAMERAVSHSYGVNQ